MNRSLLFAGVAALLVTGLVVGLYYYTLPAPSPENQLQSEIEQGRIYQNTTFSLKNSPYKFTDDVVVLPRATLTIEAGVKVTFSSSVSLTVNGSLNAIGTADNPINFTSSDPSAIVWGSIKFFGDTSESLILNYIEVTNATQGIVIDNENNGIAQIDHCYIHDNQETGIQFTAHGNITIKESTITHNNIGIYGVGYTRKSNPSDPYPYCAYLDSILLQSNTIQFNNWDGVQLSSGAKEAGSISNISLLSNIISDNGGNGIQVAAYSGSHSFVSGVNFTSNTITNNGKQGVELISSSYGSDKLLSDVSFLFNNISTNGETGVHLSVTPNQKTTGYNTVFTNNTFFGNRQEGILVEGTVTSNITANAIMQNAYGVRFNGTQNNAAELNSMSSNTFGMFVSDGATVQAQNNYWGDPTGPYHSTLNPQGKGNSVNGNGTDLNFTPFLTTNP